MMVVVVATISTILLTRATQMETESAKENLENMTGLYAKDIQIRDEVYLDIANTIANIVNGYENMEITTRRSLFIQMMQASLASNPTLMAIYMAWRPGVIDGMDAEYADTLGSDPQGNFIPIVTRESGAIEIRTLSEWRAALMDLKNIPTINDPRMRLVNGKEILLTDIVLPIMANGNSVGLIGVRFTLDFSQERVVGLTPYGTGRSIVISYDGTVAAHYDASKRGQALDEAAADILTPEVSNQIRESLKIGKIATVEAKGRIICSYPFYIGKIDTAWAFLSSVEKTRILENVNTLTNFTVLLALAAVAAATIITYLVVSNTVKPITNVASTLKDISEGEGDLTRTVDVHSTDEVGDLARYFNATLEKIKNLIVIIKKQSVILFDVGNQLSSNMAETAAAVNEITSNLQSMKGQAINQSASVIEANAMMEQITNNIDNLSIQVNRQSASVSQSSSSIEEMLANIHSVTQTLVKNTDNVRGLIDAAEVGRTGLQAVSSDIQEISRESEGLLEINAVMENIASQTNLLSMNAAIEAAHAGEAGKGFAVVADEIRKLAENSGRQSQTISTVLKKIKDAIDKISLSTSGVINKFEAIDRGVKVVSEQENSILSAMEEQGEGSKQILEAMSSLNEVSLVVKGGSEEMLSGSQQVIQESKNLGMATQEITNGMNEMVNGAERINIAVNRVNELSEQNKENIDILVKEVAKFKIT
jgi:methyl-accepting chemotaxis protein